jgi:fatty-acid desaturase
VDADPHYSKRGFFFITHGLAHLLVTEKGRKIDLIDFLNDPVVRFQPKYYKELVVIIWGLILNITHFLN